MRLFKLDRGEVCDTWDKSAFFINLDRVNCLEERQYSNSTVWFVHLSFSTGLQVTKAAFERIKLALESNCELANIDLQPTAAKRSCAAAAEIWR